VLSEKPGELAPPAGDGSVETSLDAPL